MIRESILLSFASREEAELTYLAIAGICKIVPFARHTYDTPAIFSWDEMGCCEVKYCCIQGQKILVLPYY